MLTANDVLDKIKSIKKVSNDTELAVLLGAKGQSTVGSWRKRNSLPYEEIISFCVTEGIPLDSIFLKKEFVAEPQHPYGPTPLRPDESDLLRRYRKLEPQHQANVMEMITAYECLSEGKRGEPAVCGSEVRNLKRRSTD